MSSQASQLVYPEQILSFAFLFLALLEALKLTAWSTVSGMRGLDPADGRQVPSTTGGSRGWFPFCCVCFVVCFSYFVFV